MANWFSTGVLHSFSEERLVPSTEAFSHHVQKLTQNGIMKLLEESIGVNFGDLWFSDGFLDMTPKHEQFKK